MSKLIPSISGAACVLWVVVWSWWLSREHSAQLSSQNTVATSMQVTDVDSVFTTNAVFSFHLSDEKPVLPEESLAMFNQIANHLIDNSERTLTLTGSYLPMPHEKNQSQHPNLGIARANAIKQVLVGEGVDPDQIKVASQEVHHQLMEEGRMVGGVDFDFTNKEAEVAVVEEEEGPQDQKVAKKDTPKKVSMDGKQVALFKYNDKEYALEKRNRAMLDELRQLVRRNPSYRLNITGYSTSEEEKAIPGIAKRRAMAVRRYLVDTGVRRRNILPESQPGAAKTAEDRKVEITILE